MGCVTLNTEFVGRFQFSIHVKSLRKWGVVQSTLNVLWNATKRYRKTHLCCLKVDRDINRLLNYLTIYTLWKVLNSMTFVPFKSFVLRMFVNLHFIPVFASYILAAEIKSLAVSGGEGITRLIYLKPLNSRWFNALQCTIIKRHFCNNLLPVECLKYHLVSGESACLSSVFSLFLKAAPFSFFIS